jgi:DNA segregation ATPase FtsK/SpoIIIE-like protein
VNNGADLRVSRSLELLGNLLHTVTTFAKKEEQLSRELLNRRATTNRKYRDAVEKIDARLNSLVEETESHFRHEQERLTALYGGRRTRVRRAHAAGLRAVPKRAQRTKEKWMGDLQLKKFRAERWVASERETIAAEYTKFSARLAEQQAALAALEKHTRSAFRGYGKFRRWLDAPGAPASPDAREPDAIFDDLRSHLRTGDEQFGAFRRFALARSFSEIPLPVLVLPILMIGVVLAIVLGANPQAYGIAGGGVAVLLAIVFGLHHLGQQQAGAAAGTLARTLTEARRLHSAAAAAAEARREEHRLKVQEKYDLACAALAEQWDRADHIEAEFEKAARDKIETQTPRVAAKIEAALAPKLQSLEAERDLRREALQHDATTRKEQLTTTHESDTAAMQADEEARWAELAAEWQREITPLFQTIETMNAVAAACFPSWSENSIYGWAPSNEFLPATKFGQLTLDLSRRAGAIPRDSRLALPGSPQVNLPLALTFPGQGSLLFETQESAETAVLGALDNIILRLLSTTPPGKIAFTIIDPVGLGQSFAGLMHLGDYEESIINRRIWTQRDQIEERLAELSEHIEKVIQMYLRNEYATITEYNEQAGSVAEKYHFLVVADFPANFSDTAAKRLQSIAVSGPRCGIFTLIHWDQRHNLPDGFVPDELRKNSVCVRRDGREFILSREQATSGAALVFDPPPEPDLAVSLIHRIGKSSVDSNRVEVPFEQIAPAPAEMWTGDTTNELRISIGRTGATKQQYLAIGKGTRQHALFAGKTGSGKSTLFHVIITNLALACSPEQVEFYLIDFKKGVEFKCYATKRLPHARVVAIESDREFALSVLQRVDEELKRRGDLFRRLGVQDVAGYKKAGGTEPMPRSLLLIDEFQEFFVEDDTIAQTASLLFDRIVRQGRAFGIHVLLGSQSLGGAYSLARATLGQMVIRVALQCNEADAYLIMDDTNAAPRLLSRPGEGIYNDAGGALEGNSPFQVVWLPDDERDVWLDKVHELAEQHHFPQRTPIIFEGNAPADVRENDLLRAALDTPPAATPPAARCWLGAPNSIKGPTEAVFQKQSGNHLLIVGQRDEAALSILGTSLLALAAQHPLGGAKFVLLHSANPGSPEADFIERIITAIPHEIVQARGQDIATVMNDIAAEMKARSSGEQAADAPPVFFFIHGLHKFKKLRHEDDFSFSSDPDAGADPGAQLNDLISEGSSVGMHILATVDTFNNVNRAMNRKALSEFEMRVVFQMSANDSASLIDSPKASGLGLHRALFYNEHQGTLETFRPYATPDAEWLREAAEKLARLRG